MKVFAWYDGSSHTANGEVMKVFAWYDGSSHTANGEVMKLAVEKVL